VVEDTWHIAKAVRSVLEGIGMVVAGPVATTADAERLIAEQVPHVAVMDVKLRDEMAYSLIDRLHDDGVRVVVISSYAVFPNSTEKAAAIVRKPFSGAELVATLCHVMRPEI
jgi:DNA-binding response OmpR family regulator